MTDSPTIHQRVTAAMVAERAGVSAATVSLVVNGKTSGRVSAQIVQRVQQAVEELNYVVDKAASSLSRGSSNIVVLVAPDIANPFFGGVIAGVKEVLGSHYQLLLSVSDTGDVPHADDVRSLFAFRPAGLLVDAPSAQFLEDLAIEAPTVVIDAPDLNGSMHTVNLDVSAGATRLAEHLAEQGHRNVGYLDSVTGTATFELRREAFMSRARDLGMQPFEDPLPRSIIEFRSAADAFTAAWPRWTAAGVTAVVCATDTHAFGALHAARSLGLAVPQDVALAGFDNLPYAEISNPGMTSVDLPGRELGHAAATSLRALIEGSTAEDFPPIDARLVIRDSTAFMRRA